MANATSNGSVETYRVRLADILVDPELQIRREVDHSTVDRYARAYAFGDKFPPIRLARWNDALVLIDGWHRVGALKQIGEAEVDAEIVDAGSATELKWLAAAANLTNSKSLFNSTHREVFRRYVKAGMHRVQVGRRSYRYKTYDEIAEDLHGIRRRSTLQRWMWIDFRQVEERMGSRKPGASKGVREPSDPERGIFTAAKDALDIVVNATRALTSKERRGELVAALRQALADIETKPHVLPPEPEPVRINMDF